MYRHASATRPIPTRSLRRWWYVRILIQEQTASAHDTEQLRTELAESEKHRAALQQRCVAAEARISELGQRDADAAADAAARVAEARADAEQHASEREESLQREISVLQGHLRELRTSHEQISTQLLSTQSQSSGASDASNEQVETLVQHLQRANERAAQAERRTALVRTEAEQARTAEAAAHREHLAHVQERIAQLEQAQAQQRENSAQMHAEAERAANAQREQLAQQVRAAEEETASLRQALQQRADYDEIKRELSILRAIEFAGEDDEVAEDHDGADGEKGAAPGSNLEAHLVRRNHKLQDALATLRATVTDSQRHTAGIEAELEVQHSRVQELEALTKRLENDLLRAAHDKPEADGPPSGTAGLLPIVTSQRDRFRTRNAELEQELRTQLESMTELRGEVKRLQADNLAMYEKVRYLQNYGKSSSTDMPYPMQTRHDAEDPYRARYEQSINPFEAFRGREQSRALASLSPVDRLLHLFTSAVLGNAQMRLVFVCYAVILHLLVFGILLDAGHRAVESQ